MCVSLIGTCQILEVECFVAAPGCPISSTTCSVDAADQEQTHGFSAIGNVTESSCSPSKEISEVICREDLQSKANARESDLLVAEVRGNFANTHARLCSGGVRLLFLVCMYHYLSVWRKGAVSVPDVVSASSCYPSNNKHTFCRKLLDGCSHL